MANDWLAEGFLQLRMAATWEAYATALGGERGLADRLRAEVVGAFLRVEWLPGAREAVAQLLKAEDVPIGVDLTRAAFLQAWPGALPAQAPPDGWSGPLRRLLLGAAEAVAPGARCPDGPPPTARPFPAEPALDVHPPEQMALAWLSQASALAAWQSFAAEAREQRRQAERRQHWAALREDCTAVRQALQGTRQQQSRLQALLCPAPLARTLETAEATLTRCHAAFVELADGCAPGPPSLPGADGAGPAGLEHRVQALLENAPDGWVPKILMQLQQWLAKKEPDACAIAPWPLPSDTRELAVWAGQARYLERELPGLTAAGRARLLLARALVETWATLGLAARGWGRVEQAVDTLLSVDGLEVQLARDGDRQPKVWFAQLFDPAREQPGLGRVGLAVRPAGGNWTLFPRGEWYLPQPQTAGVAEPFRPQPQTPTEQAGAELAALIREAEAACLTAAGLTPVNGEPPPEATITFHNLDPASARKLEEQWLACQERCTARGLEVIPGRWTFLRPVRGEELGLGEDELTVVFRGQIPRGVVYRVKTFGLRREEESVQACVAYASAGPSPVGFSELFRLVEQPGNPGEEGLRQRLRAWPAACCQDALSVVAVRLFIEFWGPLGEGMREGRPDDARRFGELLAGLLREELGLETFAPEHYQDFPDGWLLLNSDRGAVTGKVEAIIRPGLKDREGNLHVPALVEVS